MLGFAIVGLWDTILNPMNGYLISHSGFETVSVVGLWDLILLPVNGYRISLHFLPSHYHLHCQSYFLKQLDVFSKFHKEASQLLTSNGFGLDLNSTMLVLRLLPH